MKLFVILLLIKLLDNDNSNLKFSTLNKLNYLIDTFFDWHTQNTFGMVTSLFINIFIKPFILKFKI